MCIQPSEAWTAFRLLGPPLAAAVVGGVIGHLLATEREITARTALLLKEAESRRRGFRRVALKFRYDLERISHLEDQSVWQEYVRQSSDLIAEASLVVGDYAAPNEFFRLAKKAGGWRHEDAQAEATKKGCTLRDVLRDSIVAAADFEVPEEFNC